MELLQDLNTWRKEVGAQIPEANPNFQFEFEETYKKGKWLKATDEEFLQHLKSVK